MSCTTAKKYKQSVKCFGYKNGKCIILSGNQKVDDDYCQYCNFYKTREQYARDRLKYLEKEISFTNMSKTEAEHLKIYLENQAQGIQKFIK